MFCFNYSVILNKNTKITMPIRMAVFIKTCIWDIGWGTNQQNILLARYGGQEKKKIVIHYILFIRETYKAAGYTINRIR